MNLEKLQDEETLGRLLLDHAVISEQELDLVKRQAQATKSSMWRVLLNLNLVSAEMLDNLVSGQGQAGPPAAGGSGQAAAVGPDGKTVAVRANLANAVETGDPPGLVEQIFDRAVEARATDIHFDPQDENRIRIRYRIDGQLHDVLIVPTHLTQSLFSRVKLLANLNIMERREPQDGHIVMKSQSTTRNFRVATVPTSRGERLVIRIIDESAVLRGLDKLGFNQGQQESVSRLLMKPYGIVTVSGPVGSGKTTTLYSCTHRLNMTSNNIMTVEDPVEYHMPGVNQLQVDSKFDWTFPKALRSMLRQDPDVLMVGEVRDNETAHIAVRASLTGVLVLTSIHANDAASTVGTLYNFGIPGYLISSSLLGVIAQRLIRRVNPATAEDYVPDEKIRKMLGLADGEMPNLKLKRAKGSSGDFGTGFLGRTGVFEVMEVNELIRDMIFRETTKDVIRQIAIDMGMMPIAQHAMSKVIEGQSTIEEVYRVALL